MSEVHRRATRAWTAPVAVKILAPELRRSAVNQVNHGYA
jgi:hypothetical protein